MRNNMRNCLMLVALFTMFVPTMFAQNISLNHPFKNPKIEEKVFFLGEGESRIERHEFTFKPNKKGSENVTIVVDHEIKTGKTFLRNKHMLVHLKGMERSYIGFDARGYAYAITYSGLLHSLKYERDAIWDWTPNGNNQYLVIDSKGLVTGIRYTNQN